LSERGGKKNKADVKARGTGVYSDTRCKESSNQGPSKNRHCNWQPQKSLYKAIARGAKPYRQGTDFLRIIHKEGRGKTKKGPRWGEKKIALKARGGGRTLAMAITLQGANNGRGGVVETCKSRGGFKTSKKGFSILSNHSRTKEKKKSNDDSEGQHHKTTGVSCGVQGVAKKGGGGKQDEGLRESGGPPET